MDFGKELKKITIVDKQPLEKPNFLKTSLITAKREDGHELKWEMTHFPDTVHILVHNVDTDELLMVRQNRIPVMVNDMSNGIMPGVVELCAGLVDKSKSLEEIAKEEVQEELGYKPHKIEMVKSIKSGVGSNGSNSHFFIAEVSEKDKISEGGGLPEEDIAIVKINADEIDDFVESDLFTDSITLFGLLYWKCYKAQK